ncbi:MAG: aminoacyl-histidine dipeptidase [Clostridiales bacterium]|nr:aminoacyl-histidine dipeptidase [Clostridiales bacterium]
MSALENLQPRKVFYYFEQICQIPHGSGNIEQISDYLIRFARKRGLSCQQDQARNVIIIKEASPGYEQEEPLILQGHMDMVAVKEPGCVIDMDKEPLRLKTDQGKIYAEGTSLGGDDGIAVAYCLALLDHQELQHPRLEILLTTDEETGMEGAKGLDLSLLRGKRMINLDQEEEGVFITSCAGGARVDINIPVRREKGEPSLQDEAVLELRITGLSGGHSGMEIDKKGGNANVLLGQLLAALTEQMQIGLLALEGGVADNAIPREAAAWIAAPEDKVGRIIAWAEEQQRRLGKQLAQSDPALAIACSRSWARKEARCSHDSIQNALSCLAMLPNGVTAMSRHMPGLVETSLNLGMMSLSEDALRLHYAVRSSVDQEREALCGKLRETAARYGAETAVRSPYPGWAYREESPLRDKMCAVYERMYGCAPRLEAIHAGLECGILAGKIPGLDCVSIGPDLQNVHTAQESMDIASVQRVWNYLVALLAEK